jgi:PIN domain nuclease of toxin-antitoxin system
MRLLLDAHALMWWAADIDLSSAAREAIADAGNEVWVSAATAWEISIKRARGRLDWPEDIVAAIQQNGFIALSIRVEHAIAAGELPPIHGDPFDRMLVAQAQSEGLTVVTRDADIARYEVAVLPA